MTCWLLMPMLRALWNSASILVETSSLAAALADQSACVTINTIAPRRDELLIRVVLGRGALLQARHRSRLASCKRGDPRWQWSDPVGWKCELRPVVDQRPRRPQIPSFRCHGLVRLSYEEPVLTYQTNIIGTLNLLEAVRVSKSK